MMLWDHPAYQALAKQWKALKMRRLAQEIRIHRMLACVAEQEWNELNALDGPRLCARYGSETPGSTSQLVDKEPYRAYEAEVRAIDRIWREEMRGERPKARRATA